MTIEMEARNFKRENHLQKRSLFKATTADRIPVAFINANIKSVRCYVNNDIQCICVDRVCIYKCIYAYILCMVTGIPAYRSRVAQKIVFCAAQCW